MSKNGAAFAQRLYDLGGDFENVGITVLPSGGATIASNARNSKTN
jgi:hypothetical protein